MKKYYLLKYCLVKFVFFVVLCLPIIKSMIYSNHIVAEIVAYSAVQNYATTSIFDSCPDLKCNNIYTQILKAGKLHIIGKEILSGCHG